MATQGGNVASRQVATRVGEESHARACAGGGCLRGESRWQTVGRMEDPQELVQAAERRLDEATAHLEHLESDLTRMERELGQLERDVSTLHVGGETSVFGSLCVGFGPPVAVLGAALFFETGVWPLGLLAIVIALVQVLLMPWLNRRTP